MFVVFAIVGLYRFSGAEPRSAFLWYLPAFVLSWGLGALVARWLSLPCERWLRRRGRPPAPGAAEAACRPG
jgi:peptidoglycan/LPS O-acetylase OafA/YrhL